MTLEAVDAYEVPLTEGMWVCITLNPPRALRDWRLCGQVVCISDPDGDVDDEGRPFGIPPRVYVAFADGVHDDFSGFVDHAAWPYGDGPWCFDDVVVIAPPGRLLRATWWVLRRVLGDA